MEKKGKSTKGAKVTKGQTLQATAAVVQIIDGATEKVAQVCAANGRKVAATVREAVLAIHAAQPELSPEQVRKYCDARFAAYVEAHPDSVKGTNFRNTWNVALNRCKVEGWADDGIRARGQRSDKGTKKAPAAGTVQSAVKDATSTMLATLDRVKDTPEAVNVRTLAVTEVGSTVRSLAKVVAGTKEGEHLRAELEAALEILEPVTA